MKAVAFRVGCKLLSGSFKGEAQCVKAILNAIRDMAFDEFKGPESTV